MAKSTSKPASGAGKKPQGSNKKDAPPPLVCDNKKARFQYEVLDTFECGLVLRGTEVKVLRQGRMSLDESYARLQDGEVFLIGSHIDEYSHGNKQNHEPKRKRKCLLHRREIVKLKQKVDVKGLTLVPLRVYFGERGYAKVTLAICKGKNTHDKRATLKEREAKKELRDA
jgi:SsrA-binding protein